MLFSKAQVPFARHDVPVSGIAEQFGKRRDVVIEIALMARLVPSLGIGNLARLAAHTE
jgi:hypothetical protein